MPDLWPDDLGSANITPPVAILREQAEILTKRTQGLIVGHVTTIREVQGFFLHVFFLMAPSLDDYSYRLLTVRHPISFYPLEITADTTGKGVSAASEAEFVQHLRAIFSAAETKQVIGAIKAQAEVVTS